MNEEKKQTVVLTEREERVAAYLYHNHLGIGLAAKSAEVEPAVGLSGNELRNVVNRLRRKDVPIASGPQGYFFAATAGEVYSTIRNLRMMEKGLQAAIEGMERAMDHYGGDAFG